MEIMEKFTKSKKNQLNNIQEGPIEQITNKVKMLIFVRDEGFMLMQNENVLSCISLDVLNNNPILSIKQNLLENGIILNQFYQNEIEGPYLISPDSKDVYYICLLVLTYNDYKFMKNNMDLTNKTKLVSIGLNYIDDIKVTDIFTQYLITKLKKDFKI